MDLSSILHVAPLIIAPGVLVLFSLVSAYVLKFGLPRTGINFDYVLFVLYVVAALLLGGAL